MTFAYPYPATRTGKGAIRNYGSKDKCRILTFQINIHAKRIFQPKCFYLIDITTYKAAQRTLQVSL